MSGWGWRGLATLGTVAVVLATGCEEPAGVSDPGRVQMVLRAAAGRPGDVLRVTAYYRRTDQSIVPLDSVVRALSESGRETVSLDLDVGLCQSDAQRDPATAGCPLRIRVALWSAQGTVVDVQTLGPFDAVPGTTVTTEPVTVRGVGTVSVVPTQVTLGVGETATVQPTVRDRSGATVSQPVLWRSESPGVATVSGTGVVTGVGFGVATIRVKVAVDSSVTAAVRVEVTRPPAIALAPTGRSFEAAQGGANPASQPVAITNGGDGILSGLSVGPIGYGAGAAAWLTTATLSGTTAPATLTLQPTTGSLAPGTYTATVPISGAASNSPQNVAVSFTVSGPELATLVITGGPGSGGSGTVTVREGAGPAQVCTITAGTAGSGCRQTWRANAVLTLTAAPTGGSSFVAWTNACSGTQAACGLTLGGLNSTTTATAVFDRAPVLTVTPSTLTFTAIRGGANPGSQPAAVTNTGGGTISGLTTSVVYGAGGATTWLAGAAVALNQTVTPATLTVAPVLGGLDVGTYTATITVTSSAGAQPVAVSFKVNPPDLATLVVAAGPGSTGSGTVSVQQGSGPPQLCTITEGVAGGGCNQTWPANAGLTLTAAPTSGGSFVTWTDGCSGTELVCSLTLGGAGSTTTATAVFDRAPAIALAPNSRTFTGPQGGASPASQTVVVTNSGGGSLGGLSVGAIGYGPGATGWLTTASLNVTTAPATVTLQPTTGALAAGTYTATVPIVSGLASNSPQNVTVTFTVTPPDLATLVVAAGPGSTGSGTVSVQPVSGPTQVCTITDGVAGGGCNQTWPANAGLTLIAAPTSGGSFVTWTDGCSGTELVCSLTLGGASSTTTATAVFDRAPAIGLTPTSRSFTALEGGASPASQTVAVSNTGGGTLSGLSVGTIVYGPGAAGWLTTASLSGTSAPVTLTLAPATGALTPGTYTATVPIVSGVASNSPQNVTVTFTVDPPLPAIALTPSSRTFTGLQGDVSPASQTVAVTNSGGGTLSGLVVGTIVYGPGATDWLTTASLSGTTAPATLTLQPTTGTLVAGTYTATVPIVSGVASNSPQNVTVTFTVDPPLPAIALTPSSRTFTGLQGDASPASQTVAVSNSGGGTLSGLVVGTIVYGPGATGWLTTASLSGTTAPATLTLQPTTGALTLGSYTATVPILSGVAGNSPQNVTVTFTVTQPDLATLVITAGPGSTGSGTVSVQLGSGTPQVCTITSGVAGTGCIQPAWPASAALTLTAAPTGGGSFVTWTNACSGTLSTCSLTLGGAGSTTTATAVFDQAPAIALTPSSRTFTGLQGGASPSSQTVTVTNSGGGTLSGLSVGTIVYGPGATGWLTTASLSGTTAPATLTLQPTTGALVAGTYTATVPIVSGVASNSPQNVTVTFTVDPPLPAILLTPTSRTFTGLQGGASPSSQAVAVTNSGGGTLSGLSVGTIVYGPGATGWLTTATLNVTTAPATLTLQPTTGALLAGTYTATVPIVSGVASNSPQNVTVTFTVDPPLPAILLTPTSRTFTALEGGANPSSQAVTITNSGGGTLSGLSVGTIVYGPGATGWLTTATLNVTTAPATLTLQPTTGALLAGSYTATVPIVSGVASNSPQNVTVTFTVDPPLPAILLTPTSRTFTALEGGANPSSQAVTITNSGGGTLSGLSVGTIVYGPGATGWLTTATLNVTTAPATLTLQPTTGALVAGTYTATVPIVSGVASNSPQNVTVTFTVDPPLPAILLTPTSRTFTALEGGANPSSQAVTITNSGGGTLSGLSVGTIVYGPGATGWLTTATLNVTTAPATLTLQPTTGALVAGTYTATVPIVSGVASNSPQNVTVTFTVDPPLPAILLTPTSRTFTALEGGANPSSQAVTITNSGGGTLSGLSVGTIVYGPGATGWVTTATLNVTTAPATLTLQPTTGALLAGSYTATVPIVSGVASNSPQNVTVTFTVSAVTSPSLTIASLTTPGGSPVNVAAVKDTVVATVNVNPGSFAVNRLDVLIGGVVVATQTFGTPIAGAVTPVLVTAITSQLRLASGQYVPVVFNGNTVISANAYLTTPAPPSPVSSSTLPITLVNEDAVLRTPTASVVPTNPVPSAVNGGNTYYKGNQTVAGYTFIAFGATTPNLVRIGSTFCGRTDPITPAGTPAIGLALVGTYACQSLDTPFEGLNRATSGKGVPGSILATYPPGATGPDGTGLTAPTGVDKLGPIFSVLGDSRWALVDILTSEEGVNPGAYVDNKAPTGGALVLSPPVSGSRWIDSTYNFRTGYTPPTDGGSGLALDAEWFYGISPAAPTTAFNGGPVHGIPISATNGFYTAKAKQSDQLGNFVDITLVGLFGVSGFPSPSPTPQVGSSRVPLPPTQPAPAKKPPNPLGAGRPVAPRQASPRQ